MKDKQKYLYLTRLDILKETQEEQKNICLFKFLLKAKKNDLTNDLNNFENVCYIKDFEKARDFVELNYENITHIDSVLVRQEFKEIKNNLIPNYSYTLGVNNIDLVFYDLCLDETKKYFNEEIEYLEYNAYIKRLIKFFIQYNSCYEQLYFDFEEKSALIPIYGKQVRELTILKNLENRQEEYKEKFKKWINEKINH